MIDIASTDELKKIILSRECVIFGAGYVAQRFFKALTRQGLGKQVRSFITSSLPTITEIDNIPVQSIEALKRYTNPMILIAVHEAVVSQIEETLLEKGYSEYIWIYPFLYEIMLGSPTICDVDLSRIWRANRDKIILPARYLAIEQYYGNNDYGYEIYKKSYNLLESSHDVVEKRLDSFIELINNWEKNGYNESKLVSVFEDYVIIDGAHRIALALYHKLNTIKCKKYPMVMSFDEIHNADAFPDINNSHMLGYTNFEQSVLINVGRYLDGGAYDGRKEILA